MRFDEALAAHQVEIIASLPRYTAANVDLDCFGRTAGAGSSCGGALV